jgi:hypothetical protein
MAVTHDRFQPPPAAARLLVEDRCRTAARVLVLERVDGRTLVAAGDRCNGHAR